MFLRCHVTSCYVILLDKQIHVTSLCDIKITQLCRCSFKLLVYLINISFSFFTLTLHCLNKSSVHVYILNMSHHVTLFYWTNKHSWQVYVVFIGKYRPIDYLCKHNITLKGKIKILKFPGYKIQTISNFRDVVCTLAFFIITFHVYHIFILKWKLRENSIEF